MARRSLCSPVQAVSSLPSPNSLWRPSALTPFFWLVTNHIARNHIRNGLRVPSKIVPAVSDVFFAAGPTPQPSSRHHPWLPRLSAMAAGESLRPAQTTDVLAAGRVVTEAFVHRPKRARVIKSSDRGSSGVHQTGVPRPSGAVKGIPIFGFFPRVEKKH